MRVDSTTTTRAGGASQPNRRARRMIKRTLVVLLVVITLIPVGYAVRSWRRTNAAQSARARGMTAFTEGNFDAALVDLSFAAITLRDDPELLAAFADVRLRTSGDKPAPLQLSMRVNRAAIDAGAPRLPRLEAILRATTLGGMLTETLAVADEILAIEPTHRGAIVAKISALQSCGRFEDAKTQLDAAIKARRDDFGLRIAFIECLRQRGSSTEELLAQVDAWRGETNALRGLQVLRATIVLDAAARDDASREQALRQVAQELDLQPPLDAEEARLRAVLLIKLGKLDEAARVIDLGRALDPAQSALACLEFSIELYRGDLEGMRASVNSVDSSVEIVGSAALRQMQQAHAAASDECGCGVPAIDETVSQQIASQELLHAQAGSRACIELVQQVAAFNSACRALRDNDVGHARQLAWSVFRASEFQWHAAGVLAIRALSACEMHGQACALAAELTKRWPTDQRLELELLSAQTAAVSAAGDAAAAIDQAALMSTARRFIDDPQISNGGLIAATNALVACAANVEVERAIELLRAREVDAWTIAQIASGAATRAGDAPRALAILVAAAGSDKIKLANAALFADRSGSAQAAQLCAQCLPDGALLVARTNTVRGDATLAAQTHAQLLLGSERLEAAVLGLAMATKFPQLMKLDVALAEAEEVRREQPTNARVLAAMADAVASGSPPDFALASDLYRRAARLDPQSSLTLIAAVYAAGQTNDSSALAMLADELLLAFPTDASAMRVVIGALAQAGNARGAADVAVRLAGTTRLDGDIALAARAMAGVNEHAEAERILDRALALRPDLVQCAEVRAALAARGVPESPTESAQRAPVEIRAVALALAADDLSGLRAALIDWPTASLSPMSRVMVVDLLRDAALRQGQCSDASIDAIRKLEGDTVARAVFLARATFLRALDSSDTTAARALADTLVNDWCAWLAAIRTAQRAGMTQSGADAARRAFAALPDEPRLLRDGLDALLADHVGDALNDARKVIERMRAKHAENRSFVEAAALLAIAQGDGAKARGELASMRTRAADDDALRSLDMCALALTGRTDLAASTLSSPILLSITNMMSLAQARSFVHALMTQASTEVTALAALHADLALRQPLDARAASDAAMAATAACAAIARATDPLATASASMRAACASGDAATIASARTALIALLPVEVGALLSLDSTARAPGTAAQSMASAVVAEEARALLARNPKDARGLALIQQSQTWNSADAEVIELFAIALANNGRTSQARELLARGDVTVERLIARARVALASSDTSGARALLAQARRLRTSRAFAPASLSQQIEELEAQLRSGA